VRVTQKNEASEAPAGAGASLSVLATRPTGPASRVRSAGLRPPLTPAPHATIDPQKAEESQKIDGRPFTQSGDPPTPPRPLLVAVAAEGVS